jgi:predicted nucleotidyltransferase component of viral defense system
MHEAVKAILAKYACRTEQDYINALKEIFQEIALLGLWRSKFYENAAFYGGTALRILYGLDRFSEDLDFSLLKPDKNFDLSIYNQAIKDELNGFGFDVSVDTKIKCNDSNIESAFIKAQTKKQFLLIEVSPDIINRIHNMNNIKIKMKVDTNPPGKFNTETRILLQPIPFSVKTYQLPDLFAGKIHALLCRPWQQRVKGRDWYDFIWYLSRNISVNLTHLCERLIQSRDWEKKSKFTITDLKIMLTNKVEKTDFENAKKDILPFIKDHQAVDLWSKEFFMELIEKIN